MKFHTSDTFNITWLVYCGRYCKGNTENVFDVSIYQKVWNTLYRVSKVPLQALTCKGRNSKLFNTFPFVENNLCMFMLYLLNNGSVRLNRVSTI